MQKQTTNLAGFAPVVADNEQLPRILFITVTGTFVQDLLDLHHLLGTPAGTEGLGTIAEVGERGSDVGRLERLRLLRALVALSYEVRSVGFSIGRQKAVVPHSTMLFSFFVFA